MITHSDENSEFESLKFKHENNTLLLSENFNILLNNLEYKKHDKYSDQMLEIRELVKSAEELYKKQKKSTASDMFDNVYDYTGQLKFDLNTGKVEEYSEKLDTEWIFINPLLSPGDSNEPVGLSMGAVRSIKIEKVERSSN